MILCIVLVFLLLMYSVCRMFFFIILFDLLYLLFIWKVGLSFVIGKCCWWCLCFDI